MREREGFTQCLRQRCEEDTHIALTAMSYYADNQVFWREFIELYQKHYCLWKVKSIDYCDRKKKKAAYEILVNKLKEVDKDANRDAVVRKINTLRSSFRKEYKKVQASKRAGKADKALYRPSLWYYDLLLFLHEREMPQSSVGNSQDSMFESVYIDDFKIDETPSGSDTHEAFPAVEDPLPHGQSPSFPRTSTQEAMAEPNKKMEKRKFDETDNLMALVGERLRASRPEDQFDTTGTYFANKLRALSTDQCIFAEKIINDVLYEASLRNLSRKSIFCVNSVMHNLNE
ncbi:hypothetical protein SK128_017607 [Halocaridina rubra]|uniref:MADF domain-containing protein n=1 Tax=Halocaridina rubra TaxID=373956 RepID=A0AAN8WG91_HALRR